MAESAASAARRQAPPTRRTAVRFHRRHPLVRLAGTVARLPHYLNLAQALARDPVVPKRHKAALAAGIGYAVLPLDLLPGIIPLIGQLDDLGALLLGLRQALAGCPPAVAAAHLRRAGLSDSALDADLRTVAVATVWLVAGAAGLAARVVRAPLRLLGRVARRGHPPAE